MTARIDFITRVSALGLLVLGLGGCATAPEPLAHSPQFAPVIPVAIDKPRMATGAIYNGRQSDNFFGRNRNYRVGDLITVMLDESGNVSFRGSDGDPIDVETGIKGWVATEEAKIYLPPRGTTGSGDRTIHGGTGPGNAPKDPRSELTQLVGKAFGIGG